MAKFEGHVTYFRSSRQPSLALDRISHCFCFHRAMGIPESTVQMIAVLFLRTGKHKMFRLCPMIDNNGTLAMARRNETTSCPNAPLVSSRPGRTTVKPRKHSPQVKPQLTPFRRRSPGLWRSQRDEPSRALAQRLLLRTPSGVQEANKKASATTDSSLASSLSSSLPSSVRSDAQASAFEGKRS